jgi:hypothetical protein
MLENIKYEIVYHIPEDINESKIEKTYHKSDIDNILTKEKPKKKKSGNQNDPKDS